VLRANHAVRLGLRAASRNPELSFAKALIDQGGNLLALVPVVLAALLVASLLQDDVVTSFVLAVRALFALRWPVLGGIAAALAIAFTASMLLWAGALPLLAADAELDRRPRRGTSPCCSRGERRGPWSPAAWAGGFHSSSPFRAWPRCSSPGLSRFCGLPSACSSERPCWGPRRCSGASFSICSPG